MRQVQRFLAETKRRRLEAFWIGLKSKASAIAYLRTTGLISADIWKAPRVVTTADALWRRVRPGIVERLIEDHRRLDARMIALADLDRFARLAAQGVRIVFIGGLPQSSRSYSAVVRGETDERVAAAMARLKRRCRSRKLVLII